MWLILALNNDIIFRGRPIEHPHQCTSTSTQTFLLALRIVKLSHFQFLCLLDQSAPAVRHMRTNGGVTLGLFMSLELYHSICLQESSELLSLKVFNIY